MHKKTGLKAVLAMLVLSILCSPGAAHAAKNTKAYTPMDTGVYGRVMNVFMGVSMWGYPTMYSVVHPMTAPNSPMTAFNATMPMPGGFTYLSSYYVHHEFTFTPWITPISCYGEAARWYYVTSWDSATIIP